MASYADRARSVVDGMMSAAAAAEGANPSDPTVRLALLDLITSELSGAYEDEILVAAIRAEVAKQREAANGAARVQETDNVRRLALNAAKQNQDHNLDGLLSGIRACDTMMRGLPEVVDNAEKSLAALVARIDDEIEHHCKAHGMPPVIAARLRERLEQPTKSILKSTRVLARGQLHIAKQLRHLSSLLLVYVSAPGGLSAHGAEMVSALGPEFGVVGSVKNAPKEPM